MGTAWNVISRLDDRGGISRTVARGIIGAAKSARDTIVDRKLTTTHWSPKRNAWIHRWPEGRVASERRWRSALDWTTFGNNYDVADILFSQYRPQLGDTVFDVGAGHGGETLHLASLVGPEGSVVAIEAAPYPFRELEKLVHLNGWAHVEPVQVALSDRPGELLISNDEASWIEGNIYASEGGVEVRAATFDEICHQRGITDVAWVKMNIEGAEKDALLGMERMAPHVHHMTISCHDFLGTEWGKSKEQVLAWLADHGFEARVRGVGDPWEAHYVYAWRA